MNASHLVVSLALGVCLGYAGNLFIEGSETAWKTRVEAYVGIPYDLFSSAKEDCEAKSGSKCVIYGGFMPQPETSE